MNAETGEEVPWERLVKGFEHEEGHFVLLDESELEGIKPKLTKTIEITQFVKLEDIEPLLFEKPYYLEPEKRGRRPTPSCARPCAKQVWPVFPASWCAPRNTCALSSCGMSDRTDGPPLSR